MSTFPSLLILFFIMNGYWTYQTPVVEVWPLFGVCRASWIHLLISFVDFENFSAIIFKCNFCSILLIFFPSENLITCILDLLAKFSLISHSISHIFHLLSVCILFWIFSSNLSSKSIILSSVVSNALLKPSH